MTINEAIAKADEMCPNATPFSEKVRWLSNLDKNIKQDIIDKHVGGDEVVFSPYDDDTSGDTELLVSAPYDDMYVFWIISRIHLFNDEIQKYNNMSTMYNNQYSEFERWYNRTYRPIQTNRKFY